MGNASTHHGDAHAPAPPVEAGPPAPTQASRFDADELAILRAAYERSGPDGLTREHFATAFGSSLPTVAIDRLFAWMSGASTHVLWDSWVNGLARASKPTPGEVGAANGVRLGLLFDLFAAETAEPSAAVHELDATSAAVEASTEAVLASSPACGGALDEPSLLALLICCAQHCAVADALGGVDALRPLVADALLLGPLSRGAWVRWSCACVPRLGDVFELLLVRAVAQLARARAPSARAARLAEERWLPQLVGLGGAALEVTTVLTPALAWCISLTVGQPAGAPPVERWRLLYTSSEHGLSFNRLSKHLIGYGGATLLCATTVPGAGGSGARAGWAAYVDAPWQPAEAGRFFGGDESALFQIAPRFHAHRASRRASNYASFVQSVRATLGGAHAHPPASADSELVAFGGTVGRYRAELTADLSRSVWRRQCATYESDEARLALAGAAGGGEEEELVGRVTALEVWGLGGDAADSALVKERVKMERNRARAGKVNRAAFGETWRDSPDKLLMELGGHVFHTRAEFHDERSL
jgi:hypothetical protein